MSSRRSRGVLPRYGTDVTDVGLAVEELVHSELLQHIPGDEVYGEEAGVIAGTSGRRWIIDPIDGSCQDDAGTGGPEAARSHDGLLAAELGQED